TITWPSGQRQYLTDVAANQILHCVEPKMTVAGLAPVGGSTTVSLSIPGDEGLAYMMLMSLSANAGIPLPDGNVLPIDFDALTQITLIAGNPFLPASL